MCWSCCIYTVSCTSVLQDFQLTNLYPYYLPPRCRFGRVSSEGAPLPPLPPQLLEQYGHPPGGYRQQAQQAQHAQQVQQAQQAQHVPWSGAASSAARAASDAHEWQGLEAGRTGSAESLNVKGSLRRKYSQLPSSSSVGSRAARGGSAGTRSNSFAAAAAAAVAAAGLAGSRTSSFRGASGSQAGAGREPQPIPAAQLLGTILESERASSSSGGRTSGTSGGGSSRGSGGGSSWDSGGGEGAEAGTEDGSTAGGAARQPGAPSRFGRQPPPETAGQAGDAAQLCAAGALPPAEQPGGGETGAARSTPDGQPPQPPQPLQPPQSPSLLARLRSLLPGCSPAGASASAAGVPGSPRQLQQALSGASRSRSLLRMLSSRQLSRVSPHSAGDELPTGGQPQPGAASLQRQVAAAAQRLLHRPASLAPGGEAQQQQARLLAAAQQHLARMQVASDEAAMHAERRQVRHCEGGSAPLMLPMLM